MVMQNVFLGNEIEPVRCYHNYCIYHRKSPDLDHNQSGLEQAAWHYFCAPQDDMSGKHTPGDTTRQIHGNHGPVTYKAARSWASYLSYHYSVFGSSKALSHASFKATAISLRSSCLYAGSPCNVRRNRTMFVSTSIVSRNTSSLQ
jgi:hypothetical protein